MSDHTGTIACGTLDRVGGSVRNEWRQLGKLCPSVSENRELRVRNGDNAQIERFTSVE
jgi:hypothetical protein